MFLKPGKYYSRVDSGYENQFLRTKLLATTFRTNEKDPIDQLTSKGSHQVDYKDSYSCNSEVTKGLDSP